jgi:hypothetical protein
VNSLWILWHLFEVKVNGKTGLNLGPLVSSYHFVVVRRRRQSGRCASSGVRHCVAHQIIMIDRPSIPGTRSVTIPLLGQRERGTINGGYIRKNLPWMMLNGKTRQVAESGYGDGTARACWPWCWTRKLYLVENYKEWKSPKLDFDNAKSWTVKWGG